MRKFTLYQAAKFTKVSRYKLEQAINEGLLKIIKGKGNIKCFIYEDELNRFLSEYGDQFVKFDFEEETTKTQDLSSFIPKDLHEKLMNEKERVIKILELQQETLLPILNDNSNKNTIKELQEKITQLELALEKERQKTASGT